MIGKMIRKNKKAEMGSAILWLYKILMLVFVVGGIIFVIISHYSRAYDIRDVEASVLASKVVDCFTKNSENPNLAGIDKEKFTKVTLLNCLSFDENEIFINASLPEEKQNVALGKENLRFYCETKEEGTTGENMPVCLNQEYSVLVDGKLEKLDLFIAILKISKNT